METNRSSRFRRAIRHLHPAHVARSFITQRTVARLADTYGLVYFGRVDPSEDEYKLVRGYTISPSQQDNHYTVGTLQGYDVRLVQRNTLALTLDKKEKRCHWLIVAIGLKTTRGLPHAYIGPLGMNDVFESAYTPLKKLAIGNTTVYPQKFTSNFAVYGRPGNVVDIERLFPPSVAIVLGDHFASMPFEVENNVLYVYSENDHPTTAVIERMLENAIWLAQNIDAITNADTIAQQ